MSGEELAAEAQISAAKRRAVEVRAEAAMLVEAVEDRAYSVSASFTAPLGRSQDVLVASHGPVVLMGPMRIMPSWWCLLVSSQMPRRCMAVFSRLLMTVPSWSDLLLLITKSLLHKHLDLRSHVANGHAPCQQRQAWKTW